MSDKTVVARVSNEQHKALHIKAIESGVSVADAIRRFLLGWLSGAVELPELVNKDRNNEH